MDYKLQNMEGGKTEVLRSTGTGTRGKNKVY
jgi:hypothetical protein